MSVLVTTGTSAETERSITAVRWVLALIGTALAVGSRMGTGAGLVSAVSVVLAVVMVATAWVLSQLPRLMARTVRPAISAGVMQFLDVACALGLVVIVNDVMADAAWALLTIPIVLASLRLRAVGVLAVWSVTSLGYVALLGTGLLAPGRAALRTAAVLERPGALLAVATGVALLTRWLQAGWVEQATLTNEAELRFRHVQAIERAGREMRGRTPDEVLTTCLHHVVELGFDAASVGGHDRETSAVGDATIVPTDGGIDAPPAGVVDLTEWHGPTGVIYSAAMCEPRTGLVIAGWSFEAPGTLVADALSELVAHTTSGVELAELLGQARFEADHDALTGLANRAHFERRLQAIAAEQQPVAMLFMDLDHFKQVNDRHGHDAGDWALQQIGLILAEHVDPIGLAARFGGDEFVAVLADRTEDAAQQLAERLITAVDALAERSVLDRGPLDLGISIGIAFADGPVAPEQLRRSADAAVFTAKAEGRGRIATTRVTPAGATPHPVAAAPAPRPLPPPVPLTALPVPAETRAEEPVLTG